MECSVRVMKGPNSGTSCKLKPGVNLIGRGAKSVLPLTSPDISWEHLSITRNGDEYIVENLSAAGTYLEDARIVAPVKLRPRDQLRLSKDTLLRFESTDAVSGGLFSGAKGTAILVVFVLAIIAGIFAIFAHSPGDPDWNGAYNRINAWMSTEVRAQRMPADAQRLFENAWRLELAEDYAGSQPLWLRLRMLLDTVEDKESLARLSAENPNALGKMLSPLPNAPADPSDDDMAAALNQFVTRRLTWSTLQLKAK
jgi:hypothetical protein